MNPEHRSGGRWMSRTLFSITFKLFLLLQLASNGALAAELDLTPDATAVREVQAGGVQVHTCSATEAGALQWTLVGPKAILVDDDGSDSGTHSLGPTWSALDGSSIIADGAHPLAKVDRPGSLPALLR